MYCLQDTVAKRSYLWCLKDTMPDQVDTIFGVRSGRPLIGMITVLISSLCNLNQKLTHLLLSITFSLQSLALILQPTDFVLGIEGTLRLTFQKCNLFTRFSEKLCTKFTTNCQQIHNSQFVYNFSFHLFKKNTNPKVFKNEHWF